MRSDEAERSVAERSIEVAERSVGILAEDSEDEDLPPELRGSPGGRTLRTRARPGVASSAWHSALRGTVCDSLQQDAARLVLEKSRTFWLDCEATPRCALEQLALSVFHAHRPTVDQAVDSTCGVEWWVQHRSSKGSGSSISLHWDTDEDLKSESGEHVPPWLATVTYLGSHGAPTLVLPLAADARGRSVRLPCGAFLSYPRPGKHLAFDGRLLHGAPHTLAATAAPAHYTRATILVNVWVGHRPAGLEPLPEDLATRLSPVEVDAMIHLSDAETAVVSPEDTGVSLEEEGVGYPFFHPPISLCSLPSPDGAVANASSLVYVPPERLQLRVGRGALAPAQEGSGRTE